MIPPGLQVGFGELVDPVWLARVASAKIVHCRISGITPGPEFRLCTAEECEAMADQIVDRGMQPLLTVRQPWQIELVHTGTLIEHFNEADIASNRWDWAPDLDATFRLISACDARSLKCYVGGAVSGLHKRGFDHLRRYPWKEIPPHVGVSIHRYPSRHSAKAVTPYGGWNPFSRRPRTRDEEVAWLFGIVGHRPLAITEFGYASAEFTPLEQEANVRFEREFWTAKGAEVLIAYSMVDHQTLTDREHTYGAWRADGTKKSWLDAFTGDT